MHHSNRVRFWHLAISTLIVKDHYAYSALQKEEKEELYATSQSLL